MSHKDVISWTTMITSFYQNVNTEKAREYFDKMHERNVVSWNSMLARYVNHGFWDDGLKFYILMKQQGIKPDCITIVSSIGACPNAAIQKFDIGFVEVIDLVEGVGFMVGYSINLIY
ncbi:putative tetratricopeptide-like helical domain superfamily [Helianthus debilis subsp. tardiflorus]